MIRYGTAAKAMRPMTSDDLLIPRLKLLLIMAKAYLKGYPLGDFRKSAITRNARDLFYDALLRAGSATGPPAGENRAMPLHQRLFLQRIQLLTVMLNAFVTGKARGNFRKKAMARNIDGLCDYLADRFQIGDAKFLKVA